MSCILPEDWLVGILDDEGFAVFLGHDQVDDATDDTPAGVHVDIDLVGEVLGLELLRAQDHVT